VISQKAIPRPHLKGGNAPQSFAGTAPCPSSLDERPHAAMNCRRVWQSQGPASCCHKPTIGPQVSVQYMGDPKVRSSGGCLFLLGSKTARPRSPDPRAAAPQGNRQEGSACEFGRLSTSFAASCCRRRKRLISGHMPCPGPGASTLRHGTAILAKKSVLPGPIFRHVATLSGLA